jgi:hypothetical protein
VGAGFRIERKGIQRLVYAQEVSEIQVANFEELRKLQIAILGKWFDLHRRAISQTTRRVKFYIEIVNAQSLR